MEVSPANIVSVQASAESFVKDSTKPALRLIVVANWKFGVLAGGVLTLFTVFYVYLQISSVIQWLMRLARR